MNHQMPQKTRSNIALQLLYSWGPVIGWMSVIFFLSSRHSVTVSPEYLWNFLFFKTLHIIEYAVLFTITARAVYLTSGKKKSSTVYRNAFIITLIYAITDEFHQRFVPSRTPQPRDVIIDAIGAGIAWIYLSTQLLKAPQKLRAWAKRLDMPL